MEITGKATIKPALFITGKMAGYSTWIILILYFSTVTDFGIQEVYVPLWIIYTTLYSGIVLVLISSLSLGRSIRIGLPGEETTLKKSGIYRFSRNPLYLGLHLISLAAMMLVPAWFVVLPGLYSFYIYHLIIQGEEEFLEERFGDSYLLYKQRTRRYL